MVYPTKEGKWITRTNRKQYLAICPYDDCSWSFTTVSKCRIVASQELQRHLRAEHGH